MRRNRWTCSAQELRRSKSNIFSNSTNPRKCRHRRKETQRAGERHDVFALRGKYPDVIIGAYSGAIAKSHFRKKRFVAPRPRHAGRRARRRSTNFSATSFNDLARKYAAIRRRLRSAGCADGWAHRSRSAARSNPDGGGARGRHASRANRCVRAAWIVRYAAVISTRNNLRPMNR